MRRGTRVGQAYVAITADGSGVNDDIVDSVDGADVGPAGERKGEDFGESFSDGFSARMDEMFDKIGKNLDKNLSERFDKIGANLGRRLSKGIGEALGPELTDRLESQFAELFDTLDDRLSKVGSGGGGGGSSTVSGNSSKKQTLYNDYDFYTIFEAARIKLHQASNDAIVKSDSDLAKAQRSLLDSVYKDEEVKAKFVGAFEAARAKLHETSNDTIFKDDQALFKQQSALYERLQKEAVKRDEDMWKIRRTTADAYTKYLANLERGSIDEQGNALRRGGKDSDTSGIAAKLGGLFGAGSRNNALNLVGSTIENIIGLGEKLITKVRDIGGTFSTAFSEAGEGANIFTKTLAGASAAGGEIFTALISSAPLAVAAIVAVTLVASALVSVLGALAGIITALASTIVSGLVGALAVAGGLLGAIAVAGGLVAIAFTSMTDAQSAFLSSTFQPLKAELTGIGQLMITQIIPYFATWSTNLQNALMLILPLAAEMGDVFGRAGSILTAALSGPGFQLLTQQLAVYLPSIVLNLSNALGGFLNGVAGLFAAVLPSVSSFSQYLFDLATRFSNFVNSASGQNTISDFINRALDSAHSLFDFVGQLGGLLSDVLFSPQAQGAGNNMFDGLTDALARARKAISSGDLERWFTDAINFGKDLAKVMGIVKDVFSDLYDSGVLSAVGDILIVVANSIGSAAALTEVLIKSVEGLPGALGSIIGPLQDVGGVVGGLADGLSYVLDLMGVVEDKSTSFGTNLLNGLNAGIDSLHTGFGQAITGMIFGPNSQFSSPTPTPTDFNLQSLIDSGNNALNQTSIDNGGYKPDPVKPEPKKKPEYKNPYIDYANSLIASQPSVQQKMRQAIRQLNATVKDAITEAANSLDSGAVISGLGAQFDSLKSQGNTLVSNAQDALSSSAQTLANATSAKAAKAALKDVRANQRDLVAAQAQQDRLNRAAKILSDQQVISPANVTALVNGATFLNATLADFAEARSIVAERLASANQALENAIALRDNYASSVAQAAVSYGSIISAQAKVVNGVAQALTAQDVTSNLQDKLKEIEEFQTNLQILLGQGLSDAAYKQLVDAGVQQGGAFAKALVSGGQGSVQQTNALVDQIAGVSNSLGQEASSRLYQAGVDAAQGLVDGLTSLSAQLDSAAAALGDSIANAIRRSLGIASPAKRLIADMEYVGDGAVIGLDNQRGKVGDAAGRLASMVAMTPSLAAAYAEGRVPGAVSGNSDPRFRDLVIQTPTADPEAVAMEVLNEVTGRL